MFIVLQTIEIYNFVTAYKEMFRFAYFLIDIGIKTKTNIGPILQSTITISLKIKINPSWALFPTKQRPTDRNIAFLHSFSFDCFPIKFLKQLHEKYTPRQ